MVDGHRLVGTWQLVSSEFSDKDGRVDNPYGPNPVGVVTYGSAGNMAVQLMRGDRPHLSNEDPAIAPPHEVAEALVGITTYFGTYTVDVGAGLVTHHVIAASHPNWVGRTLERSFRFDDDRLILSTDPFVVGTRTVSGILIWQRIS